LIIVHMPFRQTADPASVPQWQMGAFLATLCDKATS
jgi:hypothetical protein